MKDRFRTALRLVALAALLFGLVYLGTRPDIRGYFSVEYLRSIASRTGWFGVASYVAVWVVGYLMQIPGVVFVFPALLAWGPWAGSLLSWVGLAVSSAASFWMIRGVGGSPAAELENRWARTILDQLDDHPIRTVALLRVVFLVNPVVNISLVLTDVSFRDYMVGSVLGFLPPLCLLAVGTETAMHYLAVSG